MNSEKINMVERRIETITITEIPSMLSGLPCYQVEVTDSKGEIAARARTEAQALDNRFVLMRYLTGENAHYFNFGVTCTEEVTKKRLHSEAQRLAQVYSRQYDIRNIDDMTQTQSRPQTQSAIESLVGVER